MMRRVHRLDVRADPPPQFGDALDRHGVSVSGRGDDAPAPLEQGGEARFRSAIFGACDGMRRDDRPPRQGGDQLRQLSE